MATKEYLINNGFQKDRLYSGLDPKNQHCVCKTWWQLLKMRKSTIERIIWKNESYKLTEHQFRQERIMNGEIEA